MWERDCGSVPVVDQENRPIAMLTDRDVCIAAFTQGKTLLDLRVASAMSSHIVTCGVYDDISTAESIMRARQIRRLPVVDGTGAMVGILSLGDIARHGHVARRVHLGQDELGGDAIASTLAAICAHR